LTSKPSPPKPASAPPTSGSASRTHHKYFNIVILSTAKNLLLSFLFVILSAVKNLLLPLLLSLFVIHSFIYLSSRSFIYLSSRSAAEGSASVFVLALVCHSELRGSPANGILFVGVQAKNLLLFWFWFVILSVAKNLNSSIAPPLWVPHSSRSFIAG
jgi:hypothetical protein